MASQEAVTDGAVNNQPVKTTPREAFVMASILKEMGINEYEPRVVNQMIEFSYRKFPSRILKKISFFL